MELNSGPFDQYSFGLVALSVFLSVLSAYAALDLAGRVPTAQGLARWGWICAAASAIGTGIWSMNFIGMQATHQAPVAEYDWTAVLLSLVASLAASGVAFYLVSGPQKEILHTIAASLFMGAGMSSVHYIGMDAMRLPDTGLYSPGVIVLSVVVAVSISFTALQLAFVGKTATSHLGWRKFGGAILLGLAVPLTHYVGMGANSFPPPHAAIGGAADSIRISVIGLMGIAVASLTIIGLVFLTSIIDRRGSERAEQLADSEARLQAIFDNLTEGIVVIDRERRTIQINRTAMLLFGLEEPPKSVEAALDAFELFDVNGEPVEQERRPIARALRNEFVQDQEFRLRAKGSGTAAICEVNSAPIVDRAGNTVEFMVRFHDITLRKSIDEVRSRLAAIVESSEDAVIGKDLRGIVTSWNRGAEKIFGYSAGEMIGQSMLILMPPGHAYEEEEILERIRRGETVDHIETVRRKKDGQLIHVSLTISPIRNAGGEVVGASKIARDITDRKQMERQLRQSGKMEAIGQLTGGVAHDFNNLLGIVVGNLDLLERQVRDNDAAVKRVQTAQRAAARGADLTRRLLSFSSREELNPAPLRVEDSVQNMIGLAAHAIGPEIVVVTHFDRTVPVVFVDGSGLENALLNLVVNARDAMPKGGTITISTKLRDLESSYPPVLTGEIKPGAYACISVSDNGQGMSQETLERAFEPFFTTKPRNKGTGLGLAMVYGFAKQSKGTVRLYSEVGYGTTVSLYLPLAVEPARAARAAGKPTPPLKGGGKVLVVDDETALLEIASAYLKEMGYTALQAANGASALEIFSQHPDIDLMITDVIMPGGLNGMELAQKARVLSPATKIVFTSGFPSDALAERSGTQVDGPLLNKPYQRAEFTAMIRRTLEEPAPESEQCWLLGKDGIEPGSA